MAVVVLEAAFTDRPQVTNLMEPDRAPRLALTSSQALDETCAVDHAVRRQREAHQLQHGWEKVDPNHEILIHPGRHEVLIAGEPVKLTSTEFRILHSLAARPGWVFTRDQIIDSVHGDGHHVTDRSIDVQIMSLRKKLGEGGRYIETVRGVGYRFKEEK